MSAVGNSFDASQQKALQDLRGLVRERTGHPRFHDVMLLRFLRARDFDVTAAWTMFSEHLDWRQSIGLDCEPSESSPSAQELDSESVACLRRCYPHGFYGIDRDGHPIYIERLGKADFDELFKTVTSDEMMQYFAHDTERTMSHRFLGCSMALDRVIDKSVTILDLEGVGMNKSVWSILSQRTKMLSNHFPDTLKQMLIVNAPRTFSLTWKMVKSMLDPKTVQKIKFFSGGQAQRDALQALADPTNLPQFLGGTCTCEEISCLWSDKGPWQDPKIVSQLASAHHWELWSRFAPARPRVSVASSTGQSSSSLADDDANAVPLPEKSDGEDSVFIIPAGSLAGRPTAVTPALKPTSDEKDVHMPRKLKVHCPSAVWKRQQKILEEAYARILQDALGRLPRSQRNTWRAQVKTYFDRLLNLYNSKAATEDLAAKFQEVMNEHSRLKVELKHAEGKLLSLNDKQKNNGDCSPDESPDTGGDILRQLSEVSMLTTNIMDTQIQRDRLHVEFKTELEKLSGLRAIVQSMRCRHATCCCRPLDPDVKAYIKLQEALSDTLADLELEQLVCTAPLKPASGNPPGVADTDGGCREATCCIEDLGTVSDAASFYSCDEGESRCASPSLS